MLQAGGVWFRGFLSANYKTRKKGLIFFGERKAGNTEKLA